MRLRTILIVLAAVVLLPVAGLAVFLATFDPNAYKPRIAEAVQNATGRTLRLSGPIRIKPALVPTISVADVGLSNAPWGSRPEMATMNRMEAQIALLPLISGEVRIARVLLVDPDILLERTSDGRANWQLGAPRAAAAAAPTPAPAPAPAAPPASGQQPRGGIDIAVERITIEGGRVALRDALLNRHQTVELRRVELAAPGGTGPLRLDAEAVWNALPFTAALRGGPVQNLLAPGPRQEPWPIDLTLTAEGARLAARGTLAEPATGSGYDLAVEGAIDSLARLAALLPDTPLPPLRGVAFAAKAADRGGAIPQLSALSLKVGESDLAAFRPGLVLRRLEIAAETPETPVTLAAEARLADLPLSAEGRLGALGPLLPGAAPPASPWPVALRLAAGEARLALDGRIARPASLQGLDLGIEARVPQLAALSPLAGQALPAITDISLAARATDRERGAGFVLREIAASAMGSDLSGEVSLLLATRSRIEAQLSSRRLDIDALMAAMPAAPQSAPGAGRPPAAPAAPAAPSPAADGRVIPDTKLPLDALKLVDARARLAVAALQLGATAYRDVGLQLELANGRLSVPDLHATLPSGRLTGRLAVDAAQDVPPVELALHAPALAVHALLAQFGFAAPLRGDMEVELDLRGRGDSPRAIAATLDGHLGLAMPRGTLDQGRAEGVLGELWRVLLPGVARSGESPLRCAALRIEARSGQAQVRTLLVDSAVARIQGGGSANLAEERLALNLAATVRVAGAGVAVPVEVTGRFAQPTVRANPAGVVGALGSLAAGAGAGSTTGAAVGGPLGAVLGGIVGAVRPGAEEDSCPAALASARARTRTAPR